MKKNQADYRYILLGLSSMAALALPFNLVGLRLLTVNEGRRVDVFATIDVEAEGNRENSILRSVNVALSFNTTTTSD